MPSSYAISTSCPNGLRSDVRSTPSYVPGDGTHSSEAFSIRLSSRMRLDASSSHSGGGCKLHSMKRLKDCQTRQAEKWQQSRKFNSETACLETKVPGRWYQSQPEAKAVTWCLNDHIGIVIASLSSEETQEAVAIAHASALHLYRHHPEETPLTPGPA